jgi:hypothetical protein
MTLTTEQMDLINQIDPAPAEVAPTEQAPVIAEPTSTEGEAPATTDGVVPPAADLTAAQQEEVDTAHDQYEKTGTWPEGTPKWMQKAANRLTRQKHEARTRAEAAERENASLKAQLATLQESIPKPTFDKAAPSIDDYETEQEYIAATVSWEIDKREFGKNTQATSAPTVAAAPAEPLPADLGGRVAKMHEEGAKKHPDFQAVILGVPDGYFNAEIADAITQTENPEDVAYLLANNLALGERLLGMTPVKRAIALGEISTQLKSTITPRLSNAPEPINPVRGGIVSNGVTAGEDMSSLERILAKG